MADNGLQVRLEQTVPIPLKAKFECAAGELLALVGPSGSGKTTILRAIAGLNGGFRGKVSYNGTVWFDDAAGVALPPQQRRVGLVFQHYALFPHMSAVDNVAAALGELTPAVRRDRARELLDLVNLKGLEDRLPGELSGGQQQRVALARALAREPAALLLDEPFSAVDQVTRRKLQRELAQLHQRLRMPIVLVTHDLDEAGALADRMVVLQHGETLQEGPPFEVMGRPRNLQVARLVDFRNVYEGEIAAHEPERGRSLLRWNGYTLEAALNAAYAVGQKVCWGILPAHCILHRRDRPSRGEGENPVGGVIHEFLPFGENVSIGMRVDGRADRELRFSVPTHVAARNGLAAGAEVKVSLLQAGVHLMPHENLEREGGQE